MVKIIIFVGDHLMVKSSSKSHSHSPRFHQVQPSGLHLSRPGGFARVESVPPGWRINIDQRSREIKWLWTYGLNVLYTHGMLYIYLFIFKYVWYGIVLYGMTRSWSDIQYMICDLFIYTLHLYIHILIYTIYLYVNIHDTYTM